jgi:sigma-B regulation protein RsbU (phosphoserine phosphatase)
MLRELLDIHWLEDFLAGLQRSTALRYLAFDRSGRLITASDAPAEIVERASYCLSAIPSGVRFSKLNPADEPPAEIGFVCERGLSYVMAPVYVEDRLAGFAGVGEFREGPLSDADRGQWLAQLDVTSSALDSMWEALPELQRRGDATAVRSARWLARMFASVARRESQIVASSEELALVGDMAELLHGNEDLQTVLNRIVSETARVMKCEFCSLRLLDAATGEMKLAADHNRSEAYLNKGLVFHDESPIDQDALAGQIVYIEDAANDPRIRYPEDARREGIVSGLVAGLIYRGQPLGVIRIYTNHRQRFRTAQRKLLRAVAYQAATAIVQARMFREQLAAARTERQLELAGDLQMRMMRTPPPRKPAVRTASMFQPSSHVGGDYCDTFLLADGRLACVIADVVGKGVKASLLSTYLRGALQAAAGLVDNPAALVERLNRQLCRDTLPSEFITLLALAVSDDGRMLEYCNAGHEPILRLRGRQVWASDGAGLVLGVSQDERYENYGIDLQVDDLLLLYTDGAIEATNFAGEFYGRERLMKALQTNGKLELGTALRAIQWDVRRFVGLAEQTDDLTLLGLRVVA